MHSVWQVCFNHYSNATIHACHPHLHNQHSSIVNNIPHIGNHTRKKKIWGFVNTVYCKSFEVEKFHDFRRLTGNRETFPVKSFPSGKVLKMVTDIIQEKRGLLIAIQLHNCWGEFLWATINNVSCVACSDVCHIACCMI